MRLNDGVRIVTQQPRRPQCRVELVTLILELGRQATVEYDWTALKSVRERADHLANLVSLIRLRTGSSGLELSVVLVAKLQPVTGQRKIETGRTVSADGDQSLADPHQLLA